VTLADIYNFLPLSKSLLTGGMPTAEQLADAARAGVQVVINLAMPDSARALHDEAAIVGSLGMSYVGIPVDWEQPTQRNLDDFMDAMDANRDQMLLVHCQANYRVSGFIALYRVLRLGWTQDAALPDLRRIWQPEDYPVWMRFIDQYLPDRLGQ
jgi:protein tyrosine phosphatase (PTP) superfamily phosphohydrolase (DUF442 family)